MIKIVCIFFIIFFQLRYDVSLWVGVDNDIMVGVSVPMDVE